jgi:hypothetical protein
MLSAIHPVIPTCNPREKHRVDERGFSRSASHPSRRMASVMM